MLAPLYIYVYIERETERERDRERRLGVRLGADFLKLAVALRELRVQRCLGSLSVCSRLKVWACRLEVKS